MNMKWRYGNAVDKNELINEGSDYGKIKKSDWLNWINNEFKNQNGANCLASNKLFFEQTRPDTFLPSEAKSNLNQS